MGLLDLLASLTDTKKEDEDEKIKQELIEKGEQEEFNFEEEELEEDDYFFEDDKE